MISNSLFSPDFRTEGAGPLRPSSPVTALGSSPVAAGTLFEGVSGIDAGADLGKSDSLAPASQSGSVFENGFVFKNPIPDVDAIAMPSVETRSPLAPPAPVPAAPSTGPGLFQDQFSDFSAARSQPIMDASPVFPEGPASRALVVVKPATTSLFAENALTPALSRQPAGKNLFEDPFSAFAPTNITPPAGLAESRISQVNRPVVAAGLPSQRTGNGLFEAPFSAFAAPMRRPPFEGEAAPAVVMARPPAVRPAPALPRLPVGPGLFEDDPFFGRKLGRSARRPVRLFRLVRRRRKIGLRRIVRRRPPASASSVVSR
jgi:hypothetical protein